MDSCFNISFRKKQSYDISHETYTPSMHGGQYRSSAPPRWPQQDLYIQDIRRPDITSSSGADQNHTKLHLQHITDTNHKHTHASNGAIKTLEPQHQAKQEAHEDILSVGSSNGMLCNSEGERITLSQISSSELAEDSDELAVSLSVSRSTASVQPSAQSKALQRDHGKLNDYQKALLESEQDEEFVSHGGITLGSYHDLETLKPYSDTEDDDTVSMDSHGSLRQALAEQKADNAHTSKTHEYCEGYDLCEDATPHELVY